MKQITEQNGIVEINYEHRVEDNFDSSAHALFHLVRVAQIRHPDLPRHLTLKIDGHVLPSGAFDPDTFELQREFANGFLLQYLTKLVCPLYDDVNPHAQLNTVPDALKLFEPKVPVLAPQG
jgi:hypothetical protein